MKDKLIGMAKRGFNAVKNGVRRAADYLVEKSGEVVTALAGGLGLDAALHQGTAVAQSAPDASTIVTTATTTFNTVGALVASVVGFFIIVKIVKWIRK